jgi:hypothetical protein
VLTVSADAEVVESRLTAGLLKCPRGGCGGVLGPWGRARSRRVEMGPTERGKDVEVTPRRGHCRSCSRTVVLLACGFVARRMDCGAVIGAALGLSATGRGYRKIAKDLGRPASTVRGWLTAARRESARVWELSARLAVVLVGDAARVVPKGGGSPVARYVAAGAALAQAVGLVWKASPPGWLDTVTAARWCRALGPGPDPQHESAPGGGLFGGAGWMSGLGTARPPPGGPLGGPDAG